MKSPQDLNNKSFSQIESLAKLLVYFIIIASMKMAITDYNNRYKWIVFIKVMNFVIFNMTYML